jgi:hypothetical protein
MRKPIRIVGAYLALSLVIGLIGLVELYPDPPSTPLAWIALFLFALPLWIAGEALGHFLWNNRIARFVDDATSEKSFSLLRLAYGVLAVLLSIGLVAVALYGWNMVRPLFGH